MELLREPHGEGATVCLVTHDHHYAEFAERTVHLPDGRVVGQADGAALG
jgi:putative ABC transport system ATP-binding protein